MCTPACKHKKQGPSLRTWIALNKAFIDSVIQREWPQYAAYKLNRQPTDVASERIAWVCNFEPLYKAALRDGVEL